MTGGGDFTLGGWAGFGGTPAPPAAPGPNDLTFGRALGAPRAATPSAYSTTSPSAADLRLALNPLADELQQTEGWLYRYALQNGPAPTLFAFSDLPAFTASSLEVDMLRKVAWRCRPALALMPGEVAVVAYNVWATEIESAMAWDSPYGRTASFKPSAEVTAKAHDIIASYEQRFRDWRQAGYQNDKRDFASKYDIISNPNVDPRSLHGPTS